MLLIIRGVICEKFGVELGCQIYLDIAALSLFHLLYVGFVQQIFSQTCKDLILHSPKAIKKFNWPKHNLHRPTTENTFCMIL